MQGVNYLTEDQLTSEELDKLQGLEENSFIEVKDEVHILTSISPLKIHPLWDLESIGINK